MLERTIDSVIDEFLYNMEYLYNKSPKTTKPYRINLKEFNKYVFANDGKISDMINITSIDILVKWLKVRESEGLSAASLNQRIVSISKFYQYLIGLNVSINEVTRGLVKFKSDKNDGKNALSIDQSVKLLDECVKDDKKITAYEKARNEMMINLFLGCGLRIEELSLLQYHHINVDEGKIYITADISKFGKDGIVDIPPSVVELYKEYLKIRKKHKNQSDYLFISRKNNVMHTDSIRNVVKKVSQNALGSKVNPHELRHTYATQLIESGEDIMYVSEQMRHANIAITTEIYKHQVKTRENRASNNPIFSNR